MKLTCLRPRLMVAPVQRTGWRDDAERGTSHQRGYGQAWRKLREQILLRDKGLCQCPECQGGVRRVTLANEVHHIVGKAEARLLGWSDTSVDAPSNLQAINKECHAKITHEQSGNALRGGSRYG